MSATLLANVAGAIFAAPSNLKAWKVAGMGYLVMVVLATLLGYLAGLFSFKVKTRWCPSCGAVKSCPNCSGWASPLTAQRISDDPTRARRFVRAPLGRAATK